MKAEYELGLALRQRARLHNQMGRLDQARADVIAAHRCFAAVQATVEQAELEREATGPE